MSRFPFLASAAILVSSAAWGQAPPKPISRTDYIKVVDSRFAAMDTNHDGFLSHDEVVAQQPKDVAATKAALVKKWTDEFNRLDTNKDGKLSLQEYLASVPEVRSNETPEHTISRYDTNHDGKISAAEFRDPEIAKFNKVDANHDGIVTPQELQAAGGK